ncbi:XRE family transcriptional regulator (plasmid) [Frondihabitans sp. PAMC 28766]|uniref:helix-turn-helix domain-containing protein n=1 Tax=Frondihabitans sp. PAMC 28766 TaxID=1795630 RepID=UPI00078DB3B3|nr:helix-turn-helix transcriptional regulator [Frondihabitans sp. PAMC 28766]AMM22859.1 XRE family transcriptional regulator [Frondihabitans sp. PAMC 28766]
MPDTNRELADFLRRARSAGDPTRAGLPQDDRVRRVKGLRREEVALLAGVSTDYYTRLEQGRHITPSPSVLDTVARALDLDSVGREHLGHLVGANPSRAVRSTPAVQRVRPGLYQLLAALEAVPAMILGRRTDILASNALARALFSDFDAFRPRERNYARWLFLDDTARALFVDWEVQARAAVENLRFDTGHDLDDRGTRELVDELTERSREFRQWWSEHRVYQRTFGSKRLRHPIVGELTVDYETLTLPGDSEQTLFMYTTQVGTSSHQALDTLISWTQTGPRVPA